MSTTTTEPSSTDVSGTVSLRLRAVLALVACVYLVWFFKANARTEDFRLDYPRFEPWLWNLYLTCVPVGLVGMAGMWWRRRWGYWTYLGATIVASLIGVYAMGFTLIGVAIVLAFGAVWVAAREELNWDRRAGAGQEK